MRRYIVAALLLLSFSLGACFPSATDGGADPISSGLNYYYDAFPDVAIPREMSPDKKDTYVTFTSTGIKVGTLRVSGRVDLASLVSAMRGHMQRDGWNLRSVFQSSRSLMIFEKADRMCSIYISENLLTTEMLLFVSGRLADGALQYNVPFAASTESLLPSDPPVGMTIGEMYSAPVPTSSPSDGNVTVYPASGFSGGTIAQ